MRRRAVRWLAVSGLFALLTVAMTWPQALYLSSRATPHQDVYFNMWRLRWFAHALVTPSAHLFDANIFYPEPRTLALSDAMLVEGIVAAPLVWAGMKPVLMQNLLMLGAIAASGVAMFALARYLTGSRGAGVIAGIVFAFAPYRFEHIMHMELQWTMWMPLAFLALHRTFDTGRWRHGLATGACVALQMLSSIYYGIFLATLIGLGAVLLMARDRNVPLARALAPLAAGAALAAAVSAAYAIPYLRVQDSSGRPFRPGGRELQRASQELPRGHVVQLAVRLRKCFRAAVRSGASSRASSPSCSRSPASFFSRRRGGRSCTSCCWWPRSRPRSASAATSIRFCTTTCRPIAAFARPRASGCSC